MRIDESGLVQSVRARLLAAAGRPVNLEIDILARYLARMQARGA